MNSLIWPGLEHHRSRKLTLAATECALSERATVDEINSVLLMEPRVRGIASELARVTVCDRSGGASLASFEDAEILQAVRFLRTATAAALAFNDKAHCIDAA